MATASPGVRTAQAGERADLLATLAQHRMFLRVTARNLTEAQARQRSTVSALTIGGIIKHVAETERQWRDFIVDGTSIFDGRDWYAPGRLELGDGETLAATLDRYEEVAARTDAVISDLADLDAAHPLPEAPWFPPGASWTARRSVLHIIAETSQHAGHADIIRESIDGAKTMSA